MTEKMFLVGQIGEECGIWKFQGIFSTKERADDACKRPNYFYTEVEFDKELPHEKTNMDDIWFPRCEIPNQAYYVVCPVHGVWCTTCNREEVAA
ncbi:MAG: hypothetical protein ACXQS5_01855, partial [Candidatus Methanospirareceae archaeon]